MDKKRLIPKDFRINWNCHACGNSGHQIINQIKKPKFIRITCPRCTTRAVITYDNGQDELERYFRLAEDLEDNW